MAIMKEVGPADHMRDHWWWRPGWRTGRRMYTWHVTFDHQDRLHELVRAYQQVLAEFPGLDVIPQRWLHLTMQGVAFTDSISAQALSDIIAAARKRLAGHHPVTLTVGPAIIDPEAIMLKVRPAGALVPVRNRLRAAIADVLGAPGVPEPEAWAPHVSIAYSNADGVAAPYAKALSTVSLKPVDLDVTAAHLIELNRDTRLYQWVTTAEVPLPGSSSPVTAQPTDPGPA
jgi:hypothetical protein